MKYLQLALSLMTLFVGNMLWAAKSLAEGLPKYYQQFSAPAGVEDSLDHLELQVNGNPMQVRDGEILPFVRGDRVKVLRAVLKSGSSKVGEVNVVGYRNPQRGSRDSDDRGELIDTSMQLHTARLAFDKEGHVYAVVVDTGKILHGLIYLKRVDPALVSANIALNQETKTVHNGEVLSVKPRDLFKVAEVRTNLANQDNVKVQVVAKGGPQLQEIRILHGNYVFGRISLKVAHE